MPARAPAPSAPELFCWPLPSWLTPDVGPRPTLPGGAEVGRAPEALGAGTAPGAPPAGVGTAPAELAMAGGLPA